MTTAQYERWRRSRLAQGDLGPYTEVVPGRTYLLSGVPGTPVVTVLYTERFPLTDGSALGRLAEDPAGVQVRVDGAVVPVWGVDPLPGVIYVLGPIPDGAEVLADYAWTPRLTLSFDRLNDPNFVFNQGGLPNQGVGLTEARIVGQPARHEQPELAQHRYSALQRAYANLLNDPLLLRFNQGGADRYGPSRLEAAVPARTVVGFEGNTQPTDPATGPWEHVGPVLGVLNGSGGYVLTDGQAVAQPAAGGGVDFFRQRAEALSAPSQSSSVTCNVRWSLQSFAPQGDWTGWAWGWSDQARLRMVSALVPPGADWFTLGLLRTVGDESSFRAYAGRRVVLRERAGSGLDALEWPAGEVPPLRAGQRVSLDWGLVGLAQVLDVQDPVTAGSPDGVSWRVILTAPLSGPGLASGRGLELHAELGAAGSAARAFRLQSGQGGVTSLFDVGAPSGSGALVVLPPEELAVAPEVYGSLVRAGGDLFWGCLGREALTTVTVDFVRWDIRVADAARASFRVFAAAEGSEFPDRQAATPWALIDNEGSAQLLTGGFLRTQAATDLVGATPVGSWTYARREVLFTDQAASRTTARVRVDSWAEGSPAALILDDGVKHLRLALWETPDPVAPQRWASALGGGLGLEAAGWSNGFGPLMTQAHIDDRLILRWAGDGVGAPRAASAPSGLVTAGPQEAWTLTWRLRWEAFPPLIPAPWNRAPAWAGLEDGELSLYVTLGEVAGVPWVFLCSREGAVFTQGGVPLGGPCSWTAPASEGLLGTRDVELRMLRNGDWLQLWADARLIANFDLTVIPSLQPSDVDRPATRLYVGSATPAVLITDYLFSHSNLHTGQPAVGLWLDPSQPLDVVQGYSLRSAEWRGVFVEVEVRRDPVGQVLVFLNGAQAWSLDYDELPPTPASGAEPALPLGGGAGVVAWGTPSARTLALTVWDSVRFEAYSAAGAGFREAPRPNTNNWALQMTSGEPLFDVVAGRGQAVLSAYNRDPARPLLNLADLGRNIGTVLAVTDLSGAVLYGFQWSGSDADPLVLQAPLPPQPLGRVLVTFLERTDLPWRDAYLLDRPALTRLEPGTPPVPLSQVATLTARLVPVPPLTNPPAPLPSNVFPTGDGFLVEYAVSPAERAYYEDLRLLTTTVPRPDADALEVACGSLIALEFGPYLEDAYSLRADVGLGPASFWTWNSSAWNGPAVWAPARRFGEDYTVRLSLDWLEEDALAPISEVQATGVLVDYAGGTYWNSPEAVFNEAAPGQVLFSWNDPALAPVVTPVVFTVP